MPYQIIDEGNGLVFRFSGDVPFEEITVANQEGWEHPRWNKHQYQIWDFENVETFGMDGREALATAFMDNIHSRNTQPIKVALVTENEHIIKILEDYISGVESEKLEARIFSDEGEVRKWVGRND